MVAPEAPRSDHHRAASKEREKVFTKMAEGETKSGTGQMLPTNSFVTHDCHVVFLITPFKPLFAIHAQYYQDILTVATWYHHTGSVVIHYM